MLDTSTVLYYAVKSKVASWITKVQSTLGIAMERTSEV